MTKKVFINTDTWWISDWTFDNFLATYTTIPKF